MSIAITDDHQALADTVASFLVKHDSRADARALLNGATAGVPAHWDELRGLGWLGLHLPEAHGGSGFGLPELVVVIEQFGRAIATGPFVASATAGAVLATTGSDAQQAAHLPGLADGSRIGAVAFGGDVSISNGSISGTIPAVISGGQADLLLVAVGADVAIVDLRSSGVSVETPLNLDAARPSARVVLDGASAETIPGAATTLLALARTLFAAEAAGVARETTEMAAEYAKARIQFGRPIAMFQAVKHHCANMLVATELATAAVWDAARAADKGGDQFTLAAAVAASLAIPAADFCAQLNVQVHGGIGFTWEHDAHLYVRRATAMKTLIDPEAAARDITALARAGVKGERTLDLPPEAEPIREQVREFAASAAGLEGKALVTKLIDSGYAMPHWPAPWGRDAGAIEQLVIEQEFAAAGIKRPQYAITGWVILTLIQHATPDQVARWVRPAMEQDVIWCQLFSEPDAGSDAAAVKTRATRTEGGWLVNGQKVWTSGAHIAGFGFATVRTNPDVAKHAGVTTMVIDMHAPGVEVRPLKMPTGDSEFNEVFFNDVFVPDDDVVGPIDGGWTVARATLGNESVSIGGGDGGMAFPGEALIGPLDATPDRLAGGAGRVGRYIARSRAIGMLNLRSAHRAIAGGEPGPEGAVTKLVLSENMEEAAAILSALTGPDNAFLDGPGGISGRMSLMFRAMSIAGGTSEIKRNQIGERILGLPRDPLIS